MLLLCALAAVGYAALYSAGGGAEPYASRHVLRFAFGLMLMLCIALADIRFIARLSWPAYVVGVALLVLVAHMGHVGKGAQRWIELGGMQWQPSELMKLALVMALAAWFHQRVVGAGRQPAVPDPAGDRGAGPGRPDPEGA